MPPPPAISIMPQNHKSSFMLLLSLVIALILSNEWWDRQLLLAKSPQKRFSSKCRILVSPDLLSNQATQKAWEVSSSAQVITSAWVITCASRGADQRGGECISNAAARYSTEMPLYPYCTQLLHCHCTRTSLRCSRSTRCTYFHPLSHLLRLVSTLKHLSSKAWTFPSLFDFWGKYSLIGGS